VRALGSALDWLRAAFTENLSLKLISLAFSLGFYLYVNGSQNAQRTFPVSVVMLLPRDAQNRILLTQPPPTVRLTLRGGRALLDELKAEDLGTAVLDLRRAPEHYAAFETSGLEIPPGVRADIDPAGIELMWDDIILREIPVQTSVTGQPAPGYAVTTLPTADPAVVSVQGPKSVVGTLQNSRAEPFDVGGLAEGVYTRQLAIGRPPAHTNFDVDSVAVTVEIGRARLDRMILERPVVVLGQARGAVVPSAIDVKVTGPPELVSVLRPEQIVPMVDLRSLTAEQKALGSASLPVIASLEGCTLQLIPSSVVVRW
jgi:YbbR-like protein